MLLTLPYAKKRAVQLRAIDLFKVGTESRTVGREGILVYLSLKKEHEKIGRFEFDLSISSRSFKSKKNNQVYFILNRFIIFDFRDL